MIYWNDWNKEFMFMAHKVNGAGFQRIVSNMAKAMVFGPSHRVGKNKCSDKLCIHLYVSIPNNVKYHGFKCLCPDGEL